MKNKILMLMCGGVINMHVSGGKLYSPKEANADDFLNMIQGIHNLADIDTKNLFLGHSLEMNVDVWQDVVDIIKKEYNNYEGFIIITGTDSMAYMSSGLSFAMQGIGKPVIVSGSRRSIYEIKTDARVNVINAVLTATSDLSGVFVVFGDKIITGARATKSSQTSLNAFSTFNKEDFALTDNMYSSLDLPDRDSKFKRHDMIPNFSNGFDSSIICINIFPGLKMEYIKKIISAKVKAIILQVPGSGFLPEYFHELLKELQCKKIPVIISTICAEGSTSVEQYSPSDKLIELGLIEAFDMSVEAVCSKVMWMLGQKTPYSEFKMIFQSNIVGEIDKNICNAIFKNSHVSY